MTKRLRSVLLVVIAVALTISSLSACSFKVEPNEPVKGASVENGMINLDGTTVSFGENSVSDGESASMKIIKATDTETENDLCSELYELTLTEAYTKPVTVTYPDPEDYSGTAEEALLAEAPLYMGATVGMPPAVWAANKLRLREGGRFLLYGSMVLAGSSRGAAAAGTAISRLY